MRNQDSESSIELGMNEYRKCRLCPWNCGVDRSAGELGKCGALSQLRVNDYMPHFGEETCLVGDGGSGAVFFSFCTLRCKFCQTYDMSWRGEGTDIEIGRLAEIFLWIQHEGCQNLNLITPTHFLPHILLALKEARSSGFVLPVVYNSSAFEKVETLRALCGVVDVYLPDLKFWKAETAQALCGAHDYPEVAKKAVKEMYRQVGDLVLDERGRAVRGVLVRHLILPGHLEESREILNWLATEVSVDTYINVMGHYRPCHQAKRNPTLERTLTAKEYKNVWKWAQELGLHRLDMTHHKIYHLIWGSIDS